MKNTSIYDVIVIGAGVIGVSTALKLQSEGKKVLILDRSGVAEQASSKNAGAFAFTDIIPLATPGIMRKAPKWFFDPLGPLSLRPAYTLNIIPWMYKFWRASWQSNYQNALTAQVNLMAFSKNALDRQIELVDGQSLMLNEGQLQLYEGEKEFNDSLPSWNTRKAFGIKFQLLDCIEAIEEIQPGIDPRFTHAVFTPQWRNTVDPQQWVLHLFNKFKALGGDFVNISVNEVVLQGGEVFVLGENKEYQADQLVLAAGAWSKKLAKSIGDTLPLETERGYNTTLPKGAFDLRTHISFSNHGFVVSKASGGVRIGGAVEFGGLFLKPNYKRSNIMLDKASCFLNGLKMDNGTQWMGFRPSMPDSLPVISYASHTEKVIYAFGHGHLGLTQSAGTAELVSDLVFGRQSDISLQPYSAKRFY